MTTTRRYTYNEQFKVWVTPLHESFDYTDGEEVEARLWLGVRRCADLSSGSQEILGLIRDWPSKYHLSSLRHNLLRAFDFGPSDRILELGCGCGAITRFLGESHANVVAVEGSRRRGMIAARRCHDLPNVRVVCDDLMSFETEEKFDVVTLIGVLEYAPVFVSGPDPVGACIRQAASFLKQDGVLIVAIENQLGLNFFAGREEDHTGKPFFGVQGLYGAGTPVTFGRKILAERLRCAGMSSRFYYPFPDYKLPTVLLSEEAFKNADLRIGDLLGRAVDRDHAESHRTFHEQLAWQVIADNGLAQDLSNSFLVAASAGQPAAPDWLAQSYSTARLPRYWTRTTISARADGLFVRKEVLQRSSAEPADTPFVHQPADSAYVSGSLLVTGLWRLLAAEADTASVAAWCAPWIAFLRAHADVAAPPGGAPLDFLLPPDFVDCTPFNLIDTGDGLAYIDAEWRAAGPIPAFWVVARGLLYSIRGYATHASWTRFTPADLLAACGFILSESQWREVYRIEHLFQSISDKRTTPEQVVRVFTRTMGEQAPILVPLRSLGELPEPAPPHGLPATREAAGETPSARLTPAGLVRLAILLVGRKDRGGLLAQVKARFRSASGWAAARELLARYAESNEDYEAWARTDRITDPERTGIDVAMLAFDRNPVFTVLMKIGKPSPALLRNAIQSVLEQRYCRWQLLIGGALSADSAARAVLDECASLDGRIRLVEDQPAQVRIDGEFIVPFAENGRMREDALFRMAAAINQKPDLRMLYSDEDRMDGAGRRFDPWFKSDAIGADMPGSLAALRVDSLADRDKVFDPARLAPGAAGAGEILHIPRILYHHCNLDCGESPGLKMKLARFFSRHLPARRR